VGFSIAVAWAASCLAQEFTVQPLADGVYCFQSGFYTNLFVVTSEGVVATDPINSRVARRYEQAIRQITRSPVRYVIYSHDHSDHIAGGAVFRKTAKFIAHENAAPRIRARRNPEIVPPDITFQTDYTLSLGGRQLRLLYFGQNHSDSNIAIFLPAERILMFVDMVYPGSVPFRDLPGTDIRGLLEALPRVRELEFDTLIYGHGPPGGKEWVGKYIAYFGDLAAELEKARANGGGVQLRGAPRDARKALDYYVDSIVSRAVEALRPRYGRWGGFDDWAAMNARAMFFYLMMDT
jgi:glyoxylase-like metal-dependent hydrolase (beta-lactamase superfamily II)